MAATPPRALRREMASGGFPTQDGVAVVDPEALLTNPRPPPVMIESFLLDREPIPLDRPLRIAPGKDSFEIEYTALSFIHPEQIRFKYKLEGLDSAWTDVGGRRTAYYSHVPPSRYTFRVIAANSDGVWNSEGKSLPITVLAPFYFTWWFELFCFVAVAALIAALWRYRIAQLEGVHARSKPFYIS